MSSPSQTQVALFGLGLMGGGMARRLLGAGFPLTVYNRSADKAIPVVVGASRSVVLQVFDSDTEPDSGNPKALPTHSEMTDLEKEWNEFKKT